jgi:hypothetical protein
MNFLRGGVTGQQTNEILPPGAGQNHRAPGCSKVGGAFGYRADAVRPSPNA